MEPIPLLDTKRVSKYFQYASFYTTYFGIFKIEINEVLLFLFEGKKDIDEEIKNLNLGKKEYLTGLIRLLNSFGVSIEESLFIELKNYRDRLSHDLLAVYLEELDFDLKKLDQLFDLYKKFKFDYFNNIEKSINPNTVIQHQVIDANIVSFPTIELFKIYRNYIALS